MFYVFNKQKICSYLIASSTVVILLAVSIFFTGNTDTMQMSAGTSKLVPIYNVETSKKAVSITINCAWNADDVDKILEVLDKCNVKVTFFMVGDWIDKYGEAAKKIADAGHEIANHSNDTVIKAANDNGYKVIQWSIDTLDYEGLDAGQMIDRINKNLKTGSIILMHNGTDNTANSLEEIIKDIQKKGYNIVKVSDLVYSDNYEIDSNGTQKSNV